ncbi:MAG: hypothetical protein RIQ53_1484 [Pseudomonadota bacterium]|jgi:curved DNA-binding protein CbpA
MSDPPDDPLNDACADNRRNHYRVLHVQPEAPIEVIKASYRTLMLQLRTHPDLGGRHTEAAMVNAAWHVLSDPLRRADYDARLRRQTEAARGALDAQDDPGGHAGASARGASRRAPTDGFQPFAARRAQAAYGQAGPGAGPAAGPAAASGAGSGPGADPPPGARADAAANASAAASSAEATGAASTPAGRRPDDASADDHPGSRSSAWPVPWPERGDGSGLRLSPLPPRHVCPLCGHANLLTLRPDSRCARCQAPLAPLPQPGRQGQELFGRRDAVRRDQGHVASLHVGWPAPALPVRWRDLSLTGASVYVPQPIEPGQRVWLLDQALEAVAEVVGCRPQGSLQVLHLRLLSAVMLQSTGVFVSAQA